MGAPTATQIAQAAEERADEHAVVDAFQERQESFKDWREALRRYDDFMGGRWGVEYPGGRIVYDRPKIENRVRTFAEDHSRLASLFDPALRVEPISDADVQQKLALRREEVLNYYHERSEVSELYPLLYADMETSGLALVRVWPDFKAPLPRRFPEYQRLDPRGCLPSPGWRIGDPVADVMYVRLVKVRDLRKRYGDEWIGTLQHQGNPLKDSEQVRVIEFYSDEWVHFVAVRMVQHGGKGLTKTATLYQERNACERVPVVLIPRPTVDGKLRGIFDDMLAVVAAENRIQSYMLDYIDQVVYAPIVKRGVHGTIKFGPHEIIDVGQDGEISRVGPASLQPELFRLGADMERHSRRAGMSPEARAGDAPTGAASGALVESLMGGLTTYIQTLQKTMERGMRRANEIAFITDRIYCDETKSIAGSNRGKLFRLTYRPSELLEPGREGNRVIYGLGTGLDRFNRVIMLQRLQQAGYVSKVWVRNQIEGLEAPEQQGNEVIDERMLESLLAGIYANASQGNLTPWAEFQRVRGENLDPLKALPAIVAAIPAPEAPPPGQGVQPPGLPGEATPAQRTAAAQTGAPGGSTALPPLAALLGG